MARESSLSKWDGEVLLIDMIAEAASDEDREIIVAI